MAPWGVKDDYEEEEEDEEEEEEEEEEEGEFAVDELLRRGNPNLGRGNPSDDGGWEDDEDETDGDYSGLVMSLHRPIQVTLEA